MCPDSKSIVGFPEKIAEYITLRKQSKLEALAKELEKGRKALADAEVSAITQFDIDAEAKRNEIDAKFDINSWLSDAAGRADQVKMVTHAPKYTHGDARGNGVYLTPDLCSEFTSCLLSTAVVYGKHVDVIGNAAALDVASMLQIELDGESVLDRLVEGDFSVFSSFARDDVQLDEWVEGFKKVLIPKELSSHKLSKQLYFPVSDEEYHLLSPLFSTSLLHEVYEKVSHSRFSEEAKLARSHRRAGKFSEIDVVDYPWMAIQTFGGSKAQNISQLNLTRRGKSYLFNTQPPRWQDSLELPLSSVSSFWSGYERRRRVWATVRELRKYLEKTEHRSSTKSLRDSRAHYVEDLISELLQYGAQIQSLTAQTGWSEESKLPLSEQYWLDPYREDAGFQEQREKMDWVEEVSQRFSSWLNFQLNRSKSLSFGDAEFREWVAATEDALVRDLRAMST